MTSSADTDYFALFGLPRQMTIDEADLAARYRRMQSEAHPDRFAGASDLQRRLAMQQSSRINDAYAALKPPLARAAHLLSLYGRNVYEETDTALPADFLEQQLEWREALAEAADDAERQALRQEITQARDETAAAARAALTALTEGGDDTQPAYDLLRRWVYLEKLLPPAAR